MRPTYATPPVALMVLALSACSGTSSAGGIAKIDTNARTVTFYNGTVFTFGANTDLSQVNPGDSVTITYSVDPATRKNIATGIAKN